MNEFFLRIADILGVESVGESDVLGSFPEWDSLSMLSVVALLDAKYGVNITAAELKDVGTVKDLWNLAQAGKKP